MAWKFEDNSIKVMEALDKVGKEWLEDASRVLLNQTIQNSRADTGQTKGSWKRVVEDERAVVGSTSENAIWEEFGTGEFALEGNGRKGGWWYQDKDTGKWHFTTGKTPLRPLHTAFVNTKAKIIRRAEQVLKGKMN